MNASNDHIMSDVGDDPAENHSVINEEVLNTRGLNNPIVTSTESPNDQPMSDVDSGSDHSGNLSAANEQIAASSSIQTHISANSRMGLLSLPPELRVMVYRHLIVQDHPISTDWQYSTNSPPILDTCELIRQEVFQVMFAENTFFIGVMHPAVSILNDPQISAIIQNVRYEARLNSTSPHPRKLNFIHVLREFGSPAIVRSTLTIIFHVGACGNNDLLSWFNRGLARLTNFRTVQFEFVPYSAHKRAHRLCPEICNGHEKRFAPVFGPAESFANGRGLLFHPQEFLNSLPREVEVDWMDYLDGIRLDWNQDPLNADE